MANQRAGQHFSESVSKGGYGMSKQFNHELLGSAEAHHMSLFNMACSEFGVQDNLPPQPHTQLQQASAVNGVPGSAFVYNTFMNDTTDKEYHYGNEEYPNKPISDMLGYGGMGSNVNVHDYLNNLPMFNNMLSGVQTAAALSNNNDSNGISSISPHGAAGRAVEDVDAALATTNGMLACV
uniref:RNA-dependent RNA polymerase n=1 Tax=Lygus hesperus TaxID=30085 RepID=A0A0A9X0A1_LYGHE